MLFDKSLTGTEIFELSKHSHTLTTVDSNQNSKSLSDRLTEYIFRIIYKSNDLSTAVNLILELIGKQFNVSRAYIFENTEDGLYCNNTFEWCNIGIKPGIDHLQNVSYQKDLGGNYYDNFDENGIFTAGIFLSFQKVNMIFFSRMELNPFYNVQSATKVYSKDMLGLMNAANINIGQKSRSMFFRCLRKFSVISY